MIATCVIQGGEAPACFASAVADYLVYGEVKSPMCLGDIPILQSSPTGNANFQNNFMQIK